MRDTARKPTTPSSDATDAGPSELPNAGARSGRRNSCSVSRRARRRRMTSMRRMWVVVLLIALIPAQERLSTYSDAQTSPSSIEIIGADRGIDWSQAGIPGGIPNRANGTCATLNPGATATDINNAIAACSNGVVFLNAGAYSLSSGITFSGRSNVTLRGAGPDQTIVTFTGADPCGGLSANVCIFAPSTIYPGNIPYSNIRNWTAGY